MLYLWVFLLSLVARSSQRQIRFGSVSGVDDKGRKWTYDGQLFDDQPEGGGEMIWDNGDVYRGDFHLGQRHGNGVFNFKNGTVYKGKWRSNVKHGTAEEIYPNGDKFIGTYVEGRRQGKAKYIWKDGRFFEGSYLDDKKSGRGKIIWPLGRVYDGNFQDDFIHGQGTYFEADGRIIQEKFWDRGFEGIDSAGRSWKYDGDLEQNVPNGFGKIEWDNGDRFEGFFKQGEKHGNGTYFLKNGKFISGEYEFGKLKEKEES